MLILRAIDHRRMAWKNGGGVTAEIAVHPDGAALESFDWRISMADIAADGPFSAFPGVERTLSVIAGEGLRLDFADGRAVDLTPDSAPYSFAADIAVIGRLRAGPIRDLNVMSRRGRVSHRVERRVLSAARSFVAERGRLLLFIQKGEVTVSEAARPVLMQDADSVLLDSGESLEASPENGAATLLVVDIRPATRWAGLAARKSAGLRNLR